MYGKVKHEENLSERDCDWRLYLRKGYLQDSLRGNTDSDNGKLSWWPLSYTIASEF